MYDDFFGQDEFLIEPDTRDSRDSENWDTGNSPDIFATGEASDIFSTKDVVMQT